MKLRAKLILPVIGIVITVMAVVGSLVLYQTEKLFHKQTNQHYSDQLLLIDTQLHITADNIKRATNVIANRSNVRKILHLGTSIGASQTLNQIVKIYPYVNYILIVDIQGEVYAANTRNADGKKIYGEGLMGLNIKSELLTAGLLNNEVSLGLPGQDPHAVALGVGSIKSQWFSAPVVRRGSHLMGWVLVSYDWHSQISLLFQKMKKRLRQLNDPVTEILLLDHDDRVVAGTQTGSLWSSADNDWVAIRPFKIRTTEFKLLISSDKAVLLEPLIREKIEILIAVIITTIVLIVALYFILTRVLIKKIWALKNATEIISAGNLAHRVESLGQDELGSLAENFNSMADALCEAQTFLEHRVKEQTADIQKQKEELQRSNEELDNFAYVASHDLKAPLRGIDQLAIWIGEDFDDKEEAINHLQVMRSRIKRMNKLLDDLLEYSRIGRTETKWKEIDTRALLETSFEMASPPAAFRIELDDQLPTFETLAVPLEEVMRNLISNAIKHHDREDGKITVTVEDKGNTYLFKIQDDGPGIAPKYHEKVFDMFQTLKPRDQVEGSGMGLAMIKKIVTTYGGSIAVLSQENQGACFCVIWPKIIAPKEKGTVNSAPKYKSELVTT